MKKLLFAIGMLVISGCDRRIERQKPRIHFSRIPQRGEGGGTEIDTIEGTVTGAATGQQLVLYAKSGKWWLEPLTTDPFTKIQTGGGWFNNTHLGTEYAALLVGADYVPAPSLEALPATGGTVAAVAAVLGSDKSPSVILPFSGYEWRVRDMPSNRGGSLNLYDPANAWTDAGGAMHLRITRSSNRWRCAEVNLTRSLGFGTYLFSVRDTHLAPAAVFGMFNFDFAGADENFREVDMEVSRWGDPENKNAQYVIQPFYVPANVARYSLPAGPMIFSFLWEAGRVSFRTTRAGGAVVARRDFTSGVPTPGLESVHMNLYAFDAGRVALENEAEVVIDKFEYLP